MANYTLITGASSGIGLAFAKICAQNDQNLVLIARRTEELNKLKAEITAKNNIEVYLITKDLTLPTATKEIYDELQSQNIQINTLINNAGFGNYGLFQESDWKAESDMIHVNILALTHLTKLFLPQMVQNKSGKILNVASTAAFFPGPYMAIYYASKSYVLSLSEALAEELVDTGVTVTCLCPGPTISGFQKTAHAEKVKLFSNKNLPTSHQVADYGYTQMTKGTRVAVYGYMNKIMTIASGLLPRDTKAKAVKFIQK